MRFLMRAANLKDVSQLKDLAQHFFLGSLSTNSKAIEGKIKISQDSFEKNLAKEDRNFLFVLEDLDQKKIIGSSQILSAFEKNNHPHLLVFEEEGKKYLKLTKSTKGKHQLGGLILHPEYRKTKKRLGLLLSGVRFMYISIFPQEFSKTLEVNLTAPFKPEERYSAFWEEVGRKYIDKDVVTGLEMYRKEKDKFFSRFPEDLKIPLESLSEKAKKSLTSVHPETQPAYEALLKLGFYKTNKYHLIDGGMYLEAETQKIPLVSQTYSASLSRENFERESLHLLAQETSQGFFGAFARGFLKEDTFFLKGEIPFLEKDKKVLIKSCSSKKNQSKLK